VQAARLLRAGSVWGHPFRTFGFPARHDKGVWASGRLLGYEATGWVQMEDVKSTGYPVEPGFSGAPVWDDELGGVVGMAVAAETRPSVRAAYLIPADTLVTAWPGLATDTLPACPYRGLFAFREQDAQFFFGRDDLTEQLVDHLMHKRLVAVVGPSGSGKSSLVFAGAIPRVRQHQGWVVANLRPTTGPSPIAALASALLPLLEPAMSETRRLAELPQLTSVLADGRLLEVVDRALERTSAQRLLLHIDQFEELYDYPPAIARQFSDLLLAAIAQLREQGTAAVTVVLTLRADFLGRALAHAGLAEALQGSILVVGGMTPTQLRRTIEGPAADQVVYEVGLVDRILHDLGAEPGNLPLLEFTLTLLWDSQLHRTLTHASYDELGGVDGGLARYAEQVYLDDLSEPEQEAARHVFVQLCDPVRPPSTHAEWLTEPTWTRHGG
jgi:KaiC/GvpD/RAD55 family RecA-like ATPase